MHDALGTRMKENYENRTRFYLPRRTYTLLRVDGKSFHSYTKGLKKPFDLGLIDDMDETAMYLCKNIQGAKFAFVQSDEISILVTDFETPTTDMWFDGNIQKIASVSASMATAKFNKARILREVRTSGTDGYSVAYDGKLLMEDEIENFKLAEFDSRVWTIAQKTEVVNYFIWRQQDTVRNSISSLAQSLHSHKELEGKNQDQMQEMCFQKGHNWNNLDPKLKRGRFITKQEKEFEREGQKYTRNIWVSVECPIFSQDKDFLNDKIITLE
jgi:tRNA(His) 5'-end guanylyltransferase